VKSLAGEVYEEALAGLSQQARRALVEGLSRVIDNLSDGETPLCDHSKVSESVAS